MIDKELECQVEIQMKKEVQYNGLETYHALVEIIQLNQNINLKYYTY